MAISHKVKAAIRAALASPAAAKKVIDAVEAVEQGSSFQIGDHVATVADSELSVADAVHLEAVAAKLNELIQALETAGILKDQ